MNPILKKIIFVIGFILATLVLPAVILLLFVDAAQGFSVYVITFGVIIFGVLGYIVSSVRDMEKKVETTMEEIKMQNAAIAYKLSNNMDELNVAVPQAAAPQVAEPQVAEPVQQPAPASTNIPLNPSEPLVMPTVKKTVKVSDDGFDDFK